MGFVRVFRLSPCIRRVALAIAVACVGGLASASGRAADDCGAIRLDHRGANGLLGSMANLPIEDQADVDICYAEALTGMLDADRFSHGASPVTGRSSAMAAAIGQALADPAGLRARIGDGGDDRRPLFSGGGVCSTFRYLRAAGGACSKGKFSNAYHDSLVRRAWRDLELAHGLDRDRRESRRRDPGVAQRAEGLRCEADSLGAFLRLPPSSGALEILFQSGAQTNLEALRSEILEPCERGGRIALPATLDCVSHFHQPLGRRRVRELIDGRLDAPYPAQPVAVSFCSNFLIYGDDVPAEVRRADPCGKHAALVIGRERREGKCMYLVRDSFGPDCRGMHPKWAERCEKGHGNFWIEADTLGFKTFDVEWLERGTSR